jgi:hypothetical protein
LIPRRPERFGSTITARICSMRSSVQGDFAGIDEPK